MIESVAACCFTAVVMLWMVLRFLERRAEAQGIDGAREKELREALKAAENRLSKLELARTLR